MQSGWVKWPLIGAVALVAVDQIIKAAVLANPPDIMIIPGFFAIRFATNTGAAFSMLRDFPQAVTVLGILVLAVLVGYWWHRGRAAPISERLAFALLMGGALGNLIDRLRLGYVVDYLDVFVGAYHWPMFNLADAAVSVGAGCLALLSLRQRPGDSGQSSAPTRAGAGNRWRGPGRAPGRRR